MPAYITPKCDETSMTEGLPAGDRQVGKVGRQQQADQGGKDDKANDDGHLLQLHGRISPVPAPMGVFCGL